MTRRIPLEGFPMMAWETNAELSFLGYPMVPGLARFRLYRDKGRYSYISSQCFINACDTHSQEMYDFAYEITDSFDGDIGEIFTEGPILELVRLHVPEHLDGHGLWLEPFRALIQTLVEAYAPILLVLKPYPLAHEGMSKKRLASRIKALSILYRRTLGVEYLGKSEYMGKGLYNMRVANQKRKWLLLSGKQKDG